MRYPFIKMPQRNIVNRPWTFIYSEIYVTDRVIYNRDKKLSKVIKHFNKEQLDLTALATQIAKESFRFDKVINEMDAKQLLAYINSPFGCMINNDSDFIGNHVIDAYFINWYYGNHDTSLNIMWKFRSFMMSHIQARREKLIMQGKYSAYNTPLMCLARLSIDEAMKKRNVVYRADPNSTSYYMDRDFYNYLMCRITTKLICQGIALYTSKYPSDINVLDI